MKKETEQQRRIELEYDLFGVSCDDLAIESLKTQYDAIADQFDTTRRLAWPEFRMLAETTPYGAKILDLGCGNGRLLWMLREKFPKYFGIDLSVRQIEIAKVHAPDAFFCVGDMRDLPFDSAFFDEVWAMASFHHLPSRGAQKMALLQAHRVLVDGGVLKMTVWNLWQPRFWRHRLCARICFRGRGVRIPWRDPSGNLIAKRFYHALYPTEFLDLLGAHQFLVRDAFGVENGEKTEMAQAKNFCVIAKKTHRLWLRGVPIDAVTKGEAIEKMGTFLDEGGQHFVCTPNPEMVVEAQKNAVFRDALAFSALALPDGAGLLWAFSTIGLSRWRRILALFLLPFFPRFFSSPIPERVAGSEVFVDLMRLSAQRNERVFLLGAAEGIAEKCSLSLRKQVPNLSVVGTFSGNPADPQSIFDRVNASGATVLAVAFGAPKQEIFIAQNLSKMVLVKLAIGVGGSFDFLAGRVRRAPKMVQFFSLEWLWRLVLQPSRVGRIWNATGRFVALMLEK